ncbi:MAG TPA: FAD-binding oxidoreductase [Ktedonosporobacter sp.]|jgi:FAD/FMN-containing dehydrogenase|nr:FAD-binding oxidoreductase [Ktedonosporobacter sp.]
MTKEYSQSATQDDAQPVSSDHLDIVSTINMGRREFLMLGAMGTLSTLLIGCQDVQGSSKPTATATAPQPTPAPTATDNDWAQLARSLQGPLVRPGNPRYPTALQLFDPRYDSVRPAGIAYCASATDVQTCLAFVRRFSVPFAIRSGGHSYAGYSTTTGLIVDVTGMHAITVDAAGGTATIGAGARLIDVYAALAQQGMALPAGSCPTVGIAGLTLGGGVGVIGRKFGLTCDNLLSAQVVVADGRILTCDANHDPDLFWALRGGGGGNFGVVTSFTFRVHQLSTLSLFTLRWPWSSAASVVNAWQHWAPQGPDELWSNCVLLTNSSKAANPIVLVNGVYVGGVAPLNALLQQLTGQINAAPVSDYVSGATLLDTMLYEAGCSGKSIDQCHLPSQNPQGQVARDTSAVKSAYYTTALPAQAINNLISAISRRQASPNLGDGGIGMDSYGGAINRVAVDATAFAHRNALFSSQFSASWQASDPASVVTANRDWLNQTWQSMGPYASGAAYQNYVDPDLSDWQQAYYGSNLPRLQRIKAAYDPDNFFHFAQSITPAR